MKKVGFVEYDFDSNTKTLIIKRHSENTDEQYKESIFFIGSLIQKYSPDYILVDTLDYDFPIGLETQAWSTKFMAELAMKEGVKKVAYAMTKDFIAKLALSEMIENAKKMGLNVNYLSSMEEAEKWLRS